MGVSSLTWATLRGGFFSALSICWGPLRFIRDAERGCNLRDLNICVRQLGQGALDHRSGSI
ncbi:hypothetical protein ACVILL_001314 [Bradyrhizobium sp. USDA 3364]